MKKRVLFIIYTLVAIPLIYSQNTKDEDGQRQAVHDLVDTYAQARETKDSVLLKTILSVNIDQLISSGKWRKGKKESMKGMLQSSTSNPGARTLRIEKIRFLNLNSAIADARYHIQNDDGTIRKMWSTFIVVYEDNKWKIAAIRNMLPTKPQ